MDEKSGNPSADSLNEVPATALIKPQAREPYDPAITFEEYNYYANKARQEELGIAPPVLNIRRLFGKKTDQPIDELTSTLTEKDFATRQSRLQISDAEWTNASRAFRSASWGACMSAMSTYPNMNMC